MPDQAVSLGPELTIVHATDLREQLIQAMHADGHDLTLNLQETQEIDSSGVQLLIALQKSLQAQGRRLKLEASSRPVKDALALYGLALN
jgi:anti-anti-sigma factor